MIYKKVQCEKVEFTVDGRVKIEFKTLDGCESYTMIQRPTRGTMKRAYIGNIPFASTEEDIKKFLAPYKIISVEIVRFRETGQSRGFAFAEFDTGAEFERALVTHNGREIDGRRIVVNDATERRTPRMASRGRR